ncbi:polyprenyl synthetase family protein [Desulfovibrio litoralis]|uniref:Farnesyl-diphosphate synthase n=1 Tax=Desulfovibrio litoralis DSM 11393 TaxID=1121455 RepID=A0A1M7S624_9BACT|nr:farnesyl diphosphate synthase [Desulfovibrio litoralis]SHN54067.1 farnesyl-diphosphate synthase [Desulfovibrio litoralis DSM 11393]
MQVSEFKQNLKEKTKLIDSFLSLVFETQAHNSSNNHERYPQAKSIFLTKELQNPKTFIPPRIKEAMEYSLLGNGKKIRPILCLSCASLFGLSSEKVLPFAAALELIHSYSLIHDDLPAMDDDDLRRGKPSNHKAFDEATAILAGDGLLSEAFFLMSANIQELNPVLLLNALACVAQAIGASGMVGGQVLDMQYTGYGNKNNKIKAQTDKVSFEELKQMHALKTGALIKAACVSGAILAGAKDNDIKNIITYSEAIGLSFQITDDLLDIKSSSEVLGKPAGSDLKNQKVTYPSLIGMEKSEALAKQETEKALNALQEYKGQDAEFLRSMAEYILVRIN